MKAKEQRGKGHTVGLGVVIAAALALLFAIRHTMQMEAGPSVGAPDSPLKIGHQPLRQPPAGPFGDRPADGGATSHASGAMGVVEAIERVADDLRAILESDPLYAEYLKCKRQGSNTHQGEVEPSCRRMLDDALNTALSLLQHQVETGYYPTEAGDEEQVSSEVRNLVFREGTLHERVAALLVVARGPNLDGMRWQDGDYDALDRLGDVERRLFFNSHRLYPPTSAGAGVAAEHAREGSMAVRYAAVSSLGHEDASAAMALDSLAAEWRDSGELNEAMADRLGRALGECRASCTDTVEQMLRSDHKPARLAAYRALGRLGRGALSDSMVARLRAGLVDGGLSDEESLIIQRILALTGNRATAR